MRPKGAPGPARHDAGGTRRCAQSSGQAARAASISPKSGLSPGRSRWPPTRPEGAPVPSSGARVHVAGARRVEGPGRAARHMPELLPLGPRRRPHPPQSKRGSGQAVRPYGARPRAPGSGLAPGSRVGLAPKWPLRASVAGIVPASPTWTSPKAPQGTVNRTPAWPRGSVFELDTCRSPAGRVCVVAKSTSRFSLAKGLPWSGPHDGGAGAAEVLDGVSGPRLHVQGGGGAGAGGQHGAHLVLGRMDGSVPGRTVSEPPPKDRERLRRTE